MKNLHAYKHTFQQIGKKGENPFKGNKRSWPEITIEILEVTLRPSNKMKIMHKSNLNFKRFNNYFYDLVRKGFIEEINGLEGKEKYKITERGKTLLAILKKAKALLFSEEN